MAHAFCNHRNANTVTHNKSHPKEQRHECQVIYPSNPSHRDVLQHEPDSIECRVLVSEHVFHTNAQSKQKSHFNMEEYSHHHPQAIGPVATLLACWSMGIRNPEPSIRVFLTVCVIVAGVAISSIGELRFVLTGFLIQGAAVIFEAYKNALQQSLLGGKISMSSMTLLYYFAPACTLINAFYILCFEYSELQTRTPAHIGPLVILANGCLTFALNIASVTVVSSRTLRALVKS